VRLQERGYENYGGEMIASYRVNPPLYALGYFHDTE